MKNYPQYYKFNRSISIEDLIFGSNIPQTLSIVFRSKILSSISLDYKITDIFLYYFLLRQGNAMCIAEKMGVYRNHSQGEWSKLSYSQKFVNTLKTRLNIYSAENSNFSALFVVLLLKDYPRSLYVKELLLTYKVYGVICKYWGWKFAIKFMINKVMFNIFPSVAVLRNSLNIV